MPAAARSKLCSSVSAWLGVFASNSYGTPHMVKQKQDDQLEHTYCSYMRIWDVALKTCQKRWMIGRSYERGSGISVLTARHHDDDDLPYVFVFFLLTNPVLHQPPQSSTSVGNLRKGILIRSGCGGITSVSTLKLNNGQSLISFNAGWSSVTAK